MGAFNVPGLRGEGFIEGNLDLQQLSDPWCGGNRGLGRVRSLQSVNVGCRGTKRSDRRVSRLGFGGGSDRYFWGGCASDLRRGRSSSLVYDSADGWVPEWSNGLAWKACVPHKGTEGSNPSPSALLEAFLPQPASV